MNKVNDFRVLVDELAGHWTEPVLEIFKATGIHLVTVDIELEAWRALKKVLYCQFGWHQPFRLPTLVPLSTVMERCCAGPPCCWRWSLSRIPIPMNSRAR